MSLWCRILLVSLVLLSLFSGCRHRSEPARERPLVYTEAREPCSDHDPNRNLYFGDLHAHTAHSFDAWMWGTDRTPDDAYRFAKGDPDVLCDFEKLRRPPVDDCTDGTGSLGMMGLGCVSRLDYARNVLLLGLLEEERLGVNPYKLGFVADTDTHKATPGAVAEARYLGHGGKNEDTPQERLGRAGFIPKGVRANPGGLTGVWAVENSRDAIFEALRRRETYGTSGPRISVRVFGGWAFPASMCDDPDFAAAGDEGGVPMGDDLPPRPEGAPAPRFFVRAVPDDTPLQMLREARDIDVWHFATPEQVAEALPRLGRRLGRRRHFWEFLIEGWREDGLLAL